MQENPSLHLPNPMQTSLIPSQNTEAPQSPVFQKHDPLFAILYLICGYIYLQTVMFSQFGLGITLFTLCFFGISIVYIKQYVTALPKESFLYLSFALLAGVSFSLFENSGLKDYAFWFLTCLSVYWVLCATSSRVNASLNNNIVIDAIQGFFALPFSHFSKSGSALFSLLKEPKRVITILLGLIIAAPLLFWVIGLLMSADMFFYSIMDMIRTTFWDNFAEKIIKILFSLPIGFYLYGLLFGSLHPKEREVKQWALPAIPNPIFTTVLLLMIAIYTLFFVTQVLSIFTVLNGSERYGFSYSEFARGGFFELCQVAAINLGLFIVCTNFIKTLPKHVKLLLALLGANTLFIIVSALFKMFLYIDEFGLTLKRVHASWLMCIFFVVFTILIVALWRQINVTKWALLISCVAFILLCYANVGGVIASYNVGRYEAGTLATLDLHPFYQTPTEAAPALLRLYTSTDDESVKENIATFFINHHYEVTMYMNTSNLYSYSLQKHLYYQQLMQFFSDNPQYLENVVPYLPSSSQVQAGS